LASYSTKDLDLSLSDLLFTTFSLEEKVVKRSVLFANCLPELFSSLVGKERIAHPLAASGYSLAIPCGEKENTSPHLEMVC